MGKKIQKKETIKYDRTKNYKWNPDDEFVLTGEEFHVIFNYLKTAAQIQLPSATYTVFTYELMESILAKGVEQGIIEEVMEPLTPEETTNPLKS